jgi:hypothetical protein
MGKNARETKLFLRSALGPHPAYDHILTNILLNLKNREYYFFLNLNIAALISMHWNFI